MSAWYSSVSAVVRSRSATSTLIPILRGVQQGSVLSPTLFLVVMDELFHRLSEKDCGASICQLFLGGAAHADDVRSIATSKFVAEAQGAIISDFSSENGLHLNRAKTEIVKVSNSTFSTPEHLPLVDSTVTTLPQAKCLGFLWSSTLSAKPGIDHNINKARKQFFALGSSGCFLGYSNPLSAREIVESCVIPVLLHGAKNWILDETSLNLLERFQAELGRRILKLSNHYSMLSTLSWPTMKARLLSQKLRFLGKLLSHNRDNIATRTFLTVAVYNISVVEQCRFLDSTLGTKSTLIGGGCCKTQLKSIKSADMSSTLKNAERESPVC